MITTQGEHPITVIARNPGRHKPHTGIGKVQRQRMASPRLYQGFNRGHSSRLIAIALEVQITAGAGRPGDLVPVMLTARCPTAESGLMWRCCLMISGVREGTTAAMGMCGKMVSGSRVSVEPSIRSALMSKNNDNGAVWTRDRFPWLGWRGDGHCRSAALLSARLGVRRCCGDNGRVPPPWQLSASNRHDRRGTVPTAGGGQDHLSDTFDGLDIPIFPAVQPRQGETPQLPGDSKIRLSDAIRDGIVDQGWVLAHESAPESEVLFEVSTVERILHLLPRLFVGLAARESPDTNRCLVKSLNRPAAGIATSLVKRVTPPGSGLSSSLITTSGAMSRTHVSGEP